MNSVIHKIYALILISLPLFTGCEKIDANTDSQETLDTKSIVLPDNAENISLGVNEFAFDIMGTMTGEKESYVFSPLGLYTVLAMAREGAAGQTLSEMDNVLHTESLPTLSIKEYCRAVLMYAQASDDLDLATSAWLDNSLKIKDSFRETISTYWASEIYKCKMSSQKTLDAINEWAYEKTDGKISRFIDTMDPNALLIFINAMYFKNVWDFEFDGTENGGFTKFDGASQTVKYLCKDGTLRYSRTDSYQVATLAYKEYRQTLTLLLPAENMTLEQLSKQFTATEYEKWATWPSAGLVHMKMPSFDIHTDLDAKGVLDKIGMHSAFTGSADFSNMTDSNIQASRVLQSANLIVNEEGSEGSVASSYHAILGDSGASAEYDDFILNRPFLFFIRDSFTKAILFAGMYAGE